MWWLTKDKGHLLRHPKLPRCLPRCLKMSLTFLPMSQQAVNVSSFLMPLSKNLQHLLFWFGWRLKNTLSQCAYCIFWNVWHPSQHPSCSSQGFPSPFLVPTIVLVILLGVPYRCPSSLVHCPKQIVFVAPHLPCHRSLSYLDNPLSSISTSYHHMWYPSLVHHLRKNKCVFFFQCSTSTPHPSHLLHLYISLPRPPLRPSAPLCMFVTRKSLFIFSITLIIIVWKNNLNIS